MIILHKLRKPNTFSIEDYFMFLSYDIKSSNERTKFINIFHCNYVDISLQIGCILSFE